MAMRFGLKAQLSTFVCLVTLFSLGILSIATFFSNQNVVIELLQRKLLSMVLLKTAQISQAVNVLIGDVILLGSRGFIQNLLVNYYQQGYVSSLSTDLNQARMFLESTEDIFSATLYTTRLDLVTNINNTAFANISMPSVAYPASYFSAEELYETVSEHSPYMLGPYFVNQEYYVSLTRLIAQNNAEFNLHQLLGKNYTFGNSVGYVTAILRADHITMALNQQTDVTSTGYKSSIGLIELTEKQASDNLTALPANKIRGRYVLPTQYHSFNATFNLTTYQKCALVYHKSGAIINFQPKNGSKSSVAYASVPILNRNWAVTVQQSHKSIYFPLYRLRNMILISVFSIGAVMSIVALLVSTWLVTPIIKLQAATEQSMKRSRHHRRRWYTWILYLLGSKQAIAEYAFSDHDTNSTSGRSDVEANSGFNVKPMFVIPKKIHMDRRITDELTDLTERFNEMTDELKKRYAILENRVSVRTKEIESARVIAESANEAKSLFMANITHELRTPLNGILGMTSVCEGEEDPAKLKDALKVIFKSGELLLHLLTDLLIFSKNQVGRLDLEEKEFMLSEALTQLDAIFGTQSKRAGIDLTIACTTPQLEKLVFIGDINRILQIVINLVSNSLKFTPKGGKIDVTVSGEISKQLEQSLDEGGLERRSLLSAISSDQGDRSPGPIIRPYSSNTMSHSKSASMSQDSPALPVESVWVTFVVRDTGPGIEPALQKRIFEAFVQGDQAVATGKGGAGLGLSICRQLATLMHGSVELESEVGVGSTFTFKAPLRAIRDGSRYVIADISAVEDWPEYEVNTTYSSSSLGAHTPPADAKSPSVSGLSDSSSVLKPLTSIKSASASPSHVNLPAIEDPSSSTSTNTMLSNQSSLGNLNQANSAFRAHAFPPFDLKLERPPMSRTSSHRSDETKQSHKSQKSTGVNMGLKSLSVLVAEDNRVNQEVLIRMLKLEGIEKVSIANDGVEAVDQMRTKSNGFDVVFMDVQMPNMDGIEATKVIRNELEYHGLIIAVSAFADSSNVDNCMAVGMNHFMAKPLARPHLHRLLSNLFTTDNANS